MVAYFRADKDLEERWQFTELWETGYFKAGHFFDHLSRHIDNVFAIAEIDEIYPEIRIEEGVSNG